MLLAQFRCLDFLILLAHTHHSDRLVVGGTGVVGSLARIVDGPRSGTMLVLVFNLYADDRASVFIVQSAQLTAYLTI